MFRINRLTVQQSDSEELDFVLLLELQQHVIIYDFGAANIKPFSCDGSVIVTKLNIITYRLFGPIEKYKLMPFASPGNIKNFLDEIRTHVCRKTKSVQGFESLAVSIRVKSCHRQTTVKYLIFRMGEILDLFPTFHPH